MNKERKEKIKKGIIDWASIIIIISCLTIIIGGILAGMANLAILLIIDILFIGGIIFITILVVRHLFHPGGKATDILIATCLIAFAYKIATVASEIVWEILEDIQALIVPDNYLFLVGALVGVTFFMLGVDDLYRRYKTKYPAKE